MASSVRKRQGPPDPDRYLLADVFEGQLMRFVKDFGYADVINRGNRVDRPPKQAVFNPSRSLWISRFYDPDVLGRQLRSIEAHAADLLTLLKDVIPAELESCDMDLGPNRQDYRVILLAWENVHRFLFGDVRAEISPDNLKLTTALLADNETVFYDFEFTFSVRGTNTRMHWRAQSPCENAIRRHNEVGTAPLLLGFPKPRPMLDGPRRCRSRRR